MNLPKLFREKLRHIPLSKQRLSRPSEKELAFLLKQIVVNQRKSWRAEDGIANWMQSNKRQREITRSFVTKLTNGASQNPDYEKAAQQLWRKISLDFRK